MIRPMKWMAALLLALSVLSPVLAIAQSQELGEISNAAKRPDDKSRQALVSVFGQVVNDPLAGGGAGGGDTILAAIFQRTNVFIAIVGAVMLAWGVFRRVANTANSGNVFDNVGSSLWGPVRVVWGFSSLVPTANGWSLAQLSMLWVASVMGVGSANLTVDAATAALSQGTPMIMAPVMPQSITVARALFEADLCMHGINYGLAMTKAAGGLVDDKEYVNQKQDPSHPSGFVLTDGRGIYSCGGATVNSSKIAAQLLTSADTRDWGRFDPTVVYQAHLEALDKMQAILDPAAMTFVADTLQVQSGAKTSVSNAEVAIQSAAAAYEGIVQAKALKGVGDMSELASQVVENLGKEGWWMLGSWYQTFAMANTRLSDAVAALATVQGPSPFGSAGPAQVWQTALSAYRTQQASGKNSNTLGQPSTGPDSAGGGDNLASVVKSVFAAPGQALLKQLTGLGTDRGQLNPLIYMKNMGDYSMGVAEGSLALWVGFSAFEKVKDGWSVVGLAAKLGNLATGLGDGLSGVLDALKPFIFMMILSFFFFGVTLSVYLPMIPFIIWFGAVINWLVEVAEGIVAAPLWALAHLAADGEGMGQKTSHGYLFLLNLCLRPFLMVIGFFIGGAVMTVGGTFLMAGFSVAVQNAQFDSVTGLFSIIAYYWVFIQLCLMLVHNSFNLILILPDQVIGWLGGYASAKLGMDEQSVRSGFNQGKDKLHSQLDSLYKGGGKSAEKTQDPGEPKWPSDMGKSRGVPRLGHDRGK